MIVDDTSLNFQKEYIKNIHANRFILFYNKQNFKIDS
jgi:hypothetical protein